MNNSTSEDRRSVANEMKENIEEKIMENSMTLRDGKNDDKVSDEKVLDVTNQIEISNNNENEESKSGDEESKRKADMLSKYHEKIIKLMQDWNINMGAIEENLKNRTLSILDGSMISKKRKRTKVCRRSVSYTSESMRITKIMTSESAYKLKAQPIPTKEWAWIYHRPLIRQNAFVDSSPDFIIPEEC